jgi:hypothetical protein
MRLNTLVSQALQQKEAMIKVLEGQLEEEKRRREEVQVRFRKQLEDIEEERNALERIRRASERMEKKHKGTSSSVMGGGTHETKKTEESELDMVPTREDKVASVASSRMK